MEALVRERERAARMRCGRCRDSRAGSPELEGASCSRGLAAIIASEEDEDEEGEGSEDEAWREGEREASRTTAAGE